MAKRRTHQYTDIYLNTNDLKMLSKGRVVIKIIRNNGSEARYALHPNSAEIKAKRQISRLKAQIKKLEGER